MSKPAKGSVRPPVGAPLGDQQRQIAEQTAAFLAGGGRIQQIPRGVSGQPKFGGPQLVTVAAEPG